MKKRPGKPDIFSYRQSHVYLADLFSWYKTKNISMRNLAQKLQVSPALLSLITKGKRPLTEENVDVWAPVFSWNPQEVSFLKQLLLLENASVEEKHEALQSLSRFKSYQEDSSQEVLTYKYLSKWWNVAIREMSEEADFQEEESWIQERLLFKVSLNDIRKSLNFLNKHKLLAKYGSFRRLDCQGDVYKLSLSGFHEQILEKAVESIHLVSSDNRHILGHTLSLSRDQLPELKRILNETVERIATLAASAGKEQEVYHVALAGFPLTGKPEESP